MRKLWNKTKQLFKWLWQQLKDWRNLVIFCIVVVIVSCEVWVPYLLGIITGDAYWFGIGSICWAFWLAPFTPFLPLCIVITLGIRKIIDIVIRRKNNDT
jgi:hypothetical protein